MGEVDAALQQVVLEAIESTSSSQAASQGGPTVWLELFLRCLGESPHNVSFSLLWQTLRFLRSGIVSLRKDEHVFASCVVFHFLWLLFVRC